MEEILSRVSIYGVPGIALVSALVGLLKFYFKMDKKLELSLTAALYVGVYLLSQYLPQVETWLPNGLAANIIISIVLFAFLAPTGLQIKNITSSRLGKKK